MCQLIAKLLKSDLSIVNCHLHSEAADFLGGLRPIRNRNENNEQVREREGGREGREGGERREGGREREGREGGERREGGRENDKDDRERRSQRDTVEWCYMYEERVHIVQYIHVHTKVRVEVRLIRLEVRGNID